MLFSINKFFLLAGLIAAALSQECDPNPSPNLVPCNEGINEDTRMTKALLDYWADSTCYQMSDRSEPNMKEQCKNVCVPGEDEEISSQSCVFSNSFWADAVTGKSLLCGSDKDFEDGLTEAGKLLEKVMCPALKALDLGHYRWNGYTMPSFYMALRFLILIVAAIRSAKAYRYAFEAQDAAQQWADFFLGGVDFAGQAGCGQMIPTKEDLIAKAFGAFTSAPDELVPGGMRYDELPCPAKGCTGCKGPNCKSEKPSENEDRPARETEGRKPETSSEKEETTDLPTEASGASATPTSSSPESLALRSTLTQSSSLTTLDINKLINLVTNINFIKSIDSDDLSIIHHLDIGLKISSGNVIEYSSSAKYPAV
ncbi:hypothetical protein BS50DRAFT_594260 [Corynespora cassiicola Philippines]|uniref:Secreted protein n=1 Tax=Corynespora cassiicola Philippines TaxID=1448308 RepID=A0A2T2N328_CORCC|nr:hypothetical protein BS50DRAFT_594260 [Corynespora cassiicola Philippines]